MGSTQKIKKNDLVEVIAGNDKGKRGKVIRVRTDRQTALVEKVNMVRRHKKADATSQGGIVDKEAPLNLSNIGRVCEKCDKPTRIGYKFLEDGTKVRACKRCGEVLDK
ncbi:MAG: 50S ribosomal protein L24 [Deltaproteobacteria bacterium]|nr:50S ribosomal protein L24 [Deltaproteobacteria bacterium]